MSKNLSNSDLNEITGGQYYVENVMGVIGLSVCTGAPNLKNQDGFFWRFYGNDIMREQAMDVLIKFANRYLNDNEKFLESYFYNYNDWVDGPHIINS